MGEVPLYRKRETERERERARVKETGRGCKVMRTPMEIHKSSHVH